MKNLMTVFKFEFTELLKKKTIIISTLVIALIAFGITFVPRFIGGGEDGEAYEPEQSFYSSQIYVENETDKEFVASVFSNVEGVVIVDSADAVRKAVENDDIESGFIVKSLLDYTVVTSGGSMFNTDQAVYEAIMGQAIKAKNLADKGIDPMQVFESEDFKLNATMEKIGKDASQGMFIGFAMLFVMYMLILLYGQSVATSVAREKDSRTMELLITSTKPKVLILGKVFAVGLMGIGQILTIILGVVLGFVINKGTFPEFVLVMIQGTTTWDVLVMYAIFSILGYILYLFVFAALGSLVSKVEDVSSAITPITWIFMIAYFIASFGMNMPDSTIMKVSSYIPFVSLFTTPIRYMMTSVPAFEIIVSIALMVGVTVVIAALSIYIYRNGSLNYGNRMKLRDVVKNLIAEKKNSK